MKEIYTLVVTIIVSIALLLMIHNSYSNWHYHRTENGMIIQHAHFYKYTSENNNKAPIQEHHHSHNALYILSQTVLQLIFIVAFIVCIAMIKKNFILLDFFSFSVILVTYEKSMALRAPPSSFQTL